MKSLPRLTHFVRMVAGLTLVGLAGCGKNAISNKVADEHGQAAGALVQPINDSVEAGGMVLLVHTQGDNPILGAWIQVLQGGLDARFSLAVFGPAEISEDARTGYSGSAPVLEALMAHPECVAIISTLPMEGQDLRGLPTDLPPVFALEWAFPDAAAPLLQKGVVQAGVFEFYPTMYPNVTPDPGALVAGKYLFLDRQTIRPFIRR